MLIRTNIVFNPLVLIVIVITALAVIAGAIILQIYLSKKNNKWFGIILPVVSFLLSLLCPLGIVNTGNVWQNIGFAAATLLLANILTIVMLVIYAVIRKKAGKKAQLEKMSIQDLI